MPPQDTDDTDILERRRPAAALVPDTIWHRRVNWLALKGFGMSAAGSVSMATPFVGYLILYHDAARQYLGGLGGLLDQTGAPACGPLIGFAARLNMIYLGLLALGLGTIAFRVFAHRIIKTHTDENAYLDRSFAHLTPRNFRSMYATIRSRRPGIAKQFYDEAPWLDRKVVPRLADAMTEADQTRATLPMDLARSYFNVLDRYSHRRWAWATAMLYLVGFTLLAIPGLAFTARVLCTIVL